MAFSREVPPQAIVHVFCYLNSEWPRQGFCHLWSSSLQEKGDESSWLP